MQTSNNQQDPFILKRQFVPNYNGDLITVIPNDYSRQNSAKWLCDFFFWSNDSKADYPSYCYEKVTVS